MKDTAQNGRQEAPGAQDRLHELGERIGTDASTQSGGGALHQVVFAAGREQVEEIACKAAEAIGRAPAPGFTALRMPAPPLPSGGTLAALWATLVEAIEGVGSPAAREAWAGARAARTARREQERRLEREQLEARALTLAERMPNRLILLIDGFDQWVGRITAEGDDFALRKVLQHDPSPIVIGLASRWPPEEKPGAPLYACMAVRDATRLG